MAILDILTYPARTLTEMSVDVETIDGKRFVERFGEDLCILESGLVKEGCRF